MPGLGSQDFTPSPRQQSDRGRSPVEPHPQRKGWKAFLNY